MNLRTAVHIARYAITYLRDQRDHRLGLRSGTTGAALRGAQIPKKCVPVPEQQNGCANIVNLAEPRNRLHRQRQRPDRGSSGLTR